MARSGAEAMGFPLPLDLPPMEARLVDELPEEPGSQFEPKWDGFRCLAFRAGDEVELRAKSGKPLTRYFPEMAAVLRGLPPSRFVLDGELAIPVGETFSFEALQMRLHPADSRIKKLAAETPAVLLAFDLLATPDGKSLLQTPLLQRRVSSRGLLSIDRPRGGGEAFAVHPRCRGGTTLARGERRRSRWGDRQAPRRRLSAGRARHAQSQETAHGGLRGRRVPL